MHAEAAALAESMKRWEDLRARDASGEAMLDATLDVEDACARYREAVESK